MVIQIAKGEYVLDDKAYYGQSVDNLSVNFVGGRFNAEKHIRFHAIDKQITRGWDGSDVSPVYVYKKYEEIIPSFPIFYSVKDFLDFPLAQTMFFNKEIEFTGYVSKLPYNKRENRYLQQFKKGEEIRLPVKKEMKHDPTMSNYWHVLLKVFSYEDDNNAVGEIKITSSHERILKQLKSDFLTKCILLRPSRIQIPRCFYCTGRLNVVLCGLICKTTRMLRRLSLSRA